jgi:signal transduction histidine kinase
MRKYATISCFILTLFLYQASATDSEITHNKNILILFAFAPTTPAYRIILEGIRQKLTDEFGDSYSLHMEYLETERYPKGQYSRERFELYNRKYADVDLDLLICVGVDIIYTVRNNADNHIKNIPAITIDLDLSKYGLPFDMSLNRKTTVIGLKLDPGVSITEALNLFPMTTSVYFICGNSMIDSLYMKISEIEAKKLNDRISVNFFNNMTMDEILVRVPNLPENSLIVLAGFNKDRDNVPYYNPEAVRLISMSANAPVFTYSDMGVGEGAFGGKILSFKKTGSLAGETAVKILNGSDPESIKISDNDYYENLLDWRQLVKWNLTKLEKKEGSTILFREVTFFGYYKWYIFGAIAFLVIQSILIVALVRMNRKQKKMTRHIIETDRRYMDIIREDKILRMGLLPISLSHELNQPLTAILSTAQAGKRYLESDNCDPGLFREILDNIVEADNRAAAILKGIRGLMNLEKREKEKVDLNKLVKEISDLCETKAIELNGRLILKLSVAPVFVMADAIQIQQVLLNLISNASQSLERTANIVNTITITEKLQDGFVTISVRDFGSGIDDSVRERLFKPFVTSRKEGTGVGLAITRLIIEDHLGKIWAENKPDGGAEFTFKLKVYDSAI